MLKAGLGLMRAGTQRILRGTPVEFRNRTSKARMIEAIVSRELGGRAEGFDVLDVGCGNGDISRFFAQRNRVTGVDVKDRRNGRVEPFRFVQIDSEALPFEDGSFDLVLSHHVLEHVPDQRRHLDEIWRVLRSDGVCYLATPNKSSPIMRGHVGNMLVLRYPQMQPLFEERNFSVVEHSTDVFVRPHLYHYPLKLGRVVPRRVAHAMRALFPSHMFTLRKACRGSEPAEATHEHARS
jgi:SAM-dependent methyltransferase